MARRIPFAERAGASSEPPLQVCEINEQLRMGLWNEFHAIHDTIAVREKSPTTSKYDNKLAKCVRSYWRFLGFPIDEIKYYIEDCHKRFKDVFLKASWSSVYDLVEFSCSELQEEFGIGAAVRENFNRVLEQFRSGYRFVDDKLVLITDQVELRAIQAAVKIGDEYAPVRELCRNALRHFSARPAPDYRNAVKEAIAAVEAVCRISTGKDNGNLKETLAALESEHGLPREIREAFTYLFGFVKDGAEIRHPVLESREPDASTAKFMVVACSAFVNFVIDRAGWNSTKRSK